MTVLPKPPKRPCGSCPYRKDVPSGVWHESEYEKLAEYDKATPFQPLGVFMCHQRDGCLCGGWLQTHDADHLLALRINRVDPAAFDYQSDVETFDTGAEAMEHGLAEIYNPSKAARVLSGKLEPLVGSKSQHGTAGHEWIEREIARGAKHGGGSVRRYSSASKGIGETDGQ